MLQARWLFLGFLFLIGAGVVGITLLRVNDWQTATLAAEAALQVGDFETAELEATTALGATSAFSPVDARTLRSQANLAGALRGQHRFDEAAAIYERMIVVLTEEFGDRDYALAAPLRALAEIDVAQSLFDDARPRLERAVELSQVALSSSDPELARVHAEHARVLAAQEDFLAAAAAYRLAIATYGAAARAAVNDPGGARVDESHIDSDHAAALAGLAGAYHAQLLFKDAEQVLNRALALYPTAGPGRIAGLTALSAIHYDRATADAGDPDSLSQATTAGRRAHDMASRILGHDDPLTAAAQTALANALLAQGDTEQALELHQSALSTRERAFGPEYIDIAENLNALAAIYRNQGSHRDAESSYHRALAIIGKARGPEHPQIAASLYNLAGHYTDQGRFVDAEPLYQRAVAIREKVFGTDAPIVATTLQAYAALLRAAGRDDAAARQEARAEAIIAGQ